VGDGVGPEGLLRTKSAIKTDSVGAPAEMREHTIDARAASPVERARGRHLVLGQNWNDAQVLKTQRQNFEWFGWKTPAALSFYWQYTRSVEDESPGSYLGAIEEFKALLRTEPLR